MGVICGCLEDNEFRALAHMSIEDRAQIGICKLKKENYTGTLYSLNSLEETLDPTSIDFRAPSGPYPHFHSYARLVQVKTNAGENPGVSQNSSEIVLAPEYKVELGVYLLREVF